MNNIEKNLNEIYASFFYQASVEAFEAKPQKRKRAKTAPLPKKSI